MSRVEPIPEQVWTADPNVVLRDKLVATVPVVVSPAEERIPLCGLEADSSVFNAREGGGGDAVGEAIVRTEVDQFGVCDRGAD